MGEAMETQIPFGDDKRKVQRQLQEQGQTQIPFGNDKEKRMLKDRR
jgi:hypothetical protein